MDVIHAKNDGDGVNSVKEKKDKKRKNGEMSGLSGDEVVDEGVRKKIKTKVSSDVSDGALEVVVGKGVDKSSRKEKKRKKDIITKVDVIAEEGDKRKVEIEKGEIGDREGRKKKKKKEKRKDAECDDTISMPVDKSSRKEKKKKDKISKIDASAQEGDQKEGNIRNDETGDREVMKKKKKEKRKEVEFDDPARNAVSAVSQTDHEVNEAAELVGGKKHKKKEKRKDAQSDDTSSNAASVVHRTDHKVDEGVDLVEGKKRKKKNDSKNLGAVPLEKEHLKDCYVTAISGEEDSGNRGNEQKEEAVRSKKKGEVNVVASVVEGIQFLKGKKKKKKNSDDLGDDKESRKINHVGLMSDTEKSRDRGCIKNTLNVERDANAGALQLDEGNGTAYENSRRNKKSKRVKFSEDVEVILHTDISSKGKEMLKNGIKEKESVKDSSENKEKVDDGVIRGKRFSKEEDDIIQNAVFKYIEDHQLGEEGLHMVLNCKYYPKVKNCWKEINEALPCRPHIAVYSRAHVLFERSEAPVWTSEEIELLKKFYEKHGPDWKTLAVELGKHRFHVKDAWRRYKFPNLKSGNWSQEEYQKLFNLVNMDLSMKVYTEKKSKHGMLRDNISWEAISDDLTTRTNVLCCKKWYQQLTSPMVVEGKWANVDDYRLLDALSDLDAACEEDVNWDGLLEHRSGDLCRKRWNEMVRHIGENGLKQFNEQVEILSQRYCPDLADAREEFDNRPAVD